MVDFEVLSTIYNGYPAVKKPARHAIPEHADAAAAFAVHAGGGRVYAKA